MFKNKKMICLFIVILILMLFLVFCYFYIFTSVGTSQNLLNEKQKDSLKKELFSCDDTYNLPYFCANDLDILGMNKNGDFIDIYGVYSDAYVVKFKGYAYTMSGSYGYIYLQVSVNGNSVKVIKRENVSEGYTLSYFPFRYKLKAKFYDLDDVWDTFENKLEKRFNVIFDDDWNLSIEGNSYTLSTFKDNKVVYKEKGILK